MSDAHSIVITGAAVATSLGLTRAQTWRAVREGRCGFRPFSAIETRISLALRYLATSRPMSLSSSTMRICGVVMPPVYDMSRVAEIRSIVSAGCWVLPTGCRPAAKNAPCIETPRSRPGRAGSRVNHSVIP